MLPDKRTGNKRTSSSSGFSSARSERSDSSNSLEAKSPPKKEDPVSCKLDQLKAARRTKENVTADNSSIPKPTLAVKGKVQEGTRLSREDIYVPLHIPPNKGVLDPRPAMVKEKGVAMVSPIISSSAGVWEEGELVKPMPPLFRAGRGWGTTRPPRTNRMMTQHGVLRGEGYGEALRGEEGYMSDAPALYAARRIHHDNGSKTSDGGKRNGFDDSSSVSSGDPPEDKMPARKEEGKCRLAHVKKTDSGMQTELSPPHPAWKKLQQHSNARRQTKCRTTPHYDTKVVGGKRSAAVPQCVSRQKSGGKAKVCGGTQTESSSMHSDGEVVVSPRHYFMTAPPLRQVGGVVRGEGYATLEGGWGRRALTEADSMESLSSTSSSTVHAQIAAARANSLTHARLLLHQREMSASPRLARSNSIRSTKSDYATPLYGASQPTSPQGGVRYPLSPNGGVPQSSSFHAGGHRGSMSPYMSDLLAKIGAKDDDMHGSALSLVSTNSSIYSTAEEKSAHEIRKLKRELEAAHEKVATLTSQLATNAHMVSAFEQSLSNMTSRLQQMTAAQEQKDCELSELKQTLESVRMQQQSTHIVRRHTFNSAKNTGEEEEEEGRICRQFSTDSMSSVNSASSAEDKKKKKKGWLRNSFSRAFSRGSKGKQGGGSDLEEGGPSAPPSPLLDEPATPAEGCDVELRRELHAKELLLTDIRLDALSSQHQLDALRDTLNRMRSEMASLRQDNERLRGLVAQHAPPSPTPAPLEEGVGGKLVSVAVALEGPPAHQDEVLIGNICVTSKTKWDVLDNLVRRTFKEYLCRIDPPSSLGLTADAILHYQLGEVTRPPPDGPPELLPCGYTLDDTRIRIRLRGAREGGCVEGASFASLLPRAMVCRYVSLLSEHRRIILCGPSGTGKTHTAHALAHFLVLRDGKECCAGAVATFSVDHKSAKELRQYLANVAEQADTPPGDLPTVIILDNLHHVTSLGEVFNGFLAADYAKCPYIIGTMNQATCSTTNLQLHHNFRWVLCANHMEPVKGFLGRFLRRRLVEEECRGGGEGGVDVAGWMEGVWARLNLFLETHSSSEVTIGPRPFLSVPLRPAGAAAVWFADLWNYSLVPYLLEAAREGLQLYGRRAPFDDPAQWVEETWPWPDAPPPQPLLRLRPEDVGYETPPPAPPQDPLLNMLMRLQEAASYPPQDHPTEENNTILSNSFG